MSPFGAYTEGWALYAETLADELGVYEGNPLGRVGMLQSLLFRAVRLVVDTGIHHKRWSRAQATDYMVRNTGFPVPRTQREIDRYCASPGQACSYKVGHTVWTRLRGEAQAALGGRFDLRQFHQILLKGALPLTILEQEVDRWVASQQAWTIASGRRAPATATVRRDPLRWQNGGRRTGRAEYHRPASSIRDFAEALARRSQRPPSQPGP